MGVNALSALPCGGSALSGLVPAFCAPPVGFPITGGRTAPRQPAVRARATQFPRAAPHVLKLAPTATTTAAPDGLAPVADGLAKEGGSTAKAQHPFAGGEWAGWECAFSGKDGSRQPVPYDYVPRSLRDWDVEIWGFETLTSEQRQKTEAGEGDVLYRKRGRAFPETGCELDLLCVEVNTRKSPLQGEVVAFAAFDGGDYLLAEKPAGNSRKLQLEVGLAPGGNSHKEGQEGEENEKVRSRIGFLLDDEDRGSCRLDGPVTVTRERQYRDEFEDGLAHNGVLGGGLDTHSMAVLRGWSKCFSEEEPAPTAARLAADWTVSRPGQWKPFISGTAAGKETSVKTPPDQSARESCHRRESHWTSGSGDGSPDVGLLMRGGYTIRAGSWCRSGTNSQEVWAPAGGAEQEGDVVEPGHDMVLAVEIGWLVDGGGVGGAMKREVVTALLDEGTMIPLGVWRGCEDCAGG